MIREKLENFIVVQQAQCISVMRTEQLKLSFCVPNKLCGGLTMNCSETRTTLILERWQQAKKTPKH